ncbi:MAG: hypothetical protein AAF423_04085 [Pseudomonadota bacterium]
MSLILQGEKNLPDSRIACPACEYERGRPGKPVLEADGLHCLECGNRWKDLNDTVVFSRKSVMLAGLGAGSTLAGHTLSESRIGDFSKPRGALPGMVALAFLFLLGVGVVYAFLLGSGPGFEQEGLRVAELEFEELVRTGRGKVVRVTGTIENSGNSAETVPSVTLVLRQSNGQELTRWNYRSPVVKLRPGRKTRFISSIQNDAPVIASVEALFN